MHDVSTIQGDPPFKSHKLNFEDMSTCKVTKFSLIRALIINPVMSIARKYRIVQRKYIFSTKSGMRASISSLHKHDILLLHLLNQMCLKKIVAKENFIGFGIKRAFLRNPPVCSIRSRVH